MDFIKNVLAYPAAFRYVLCNGLTKYFLISGFISLLIGGVAFGAVYYLSDDFGAMLMSFYPFEWGKETLTGVSSVVSGTMLSALSLILYKYILLICIGPFMGPLSERVEEIETGQPKRSQGLGQIGYAMIRGLRITLRNISKELFYTVVLLILSAFPIFAPFTAVGIFLVQAYFIGFANTDYHLEKRNSVRESIQYCKSNKMAVMGNGTGFLLLLFIPIAGLLLAPVLGTVAATRSALSNKMNEEL